MTGLGTPGVARTEGSPREACMIARYFKARVMHHGHPALVTRRLALEQGFDTCLRAVVGTKRIRQSPIHGERCTGSRSRRSASQTGRRVALRSRGTRPLGDQWRLPPALAIDSPGAVEAQCANDRTGWERWPGGSASVKGENVSGGRLQPIDFARSVSQWTPPSIGMRGGCCSRCRPKSERSHLRCNGGSSGLNEIVTTCLGGRVP
ncbi:hypothetical protein OH77DRAFT_1049517 [Trametes cingulata]|nr:hypothetical protein OH77DRAFT_1049517 [Trametes cingulata]